MIFMWLKHHFGKRAVQNPCYSYSVSLKKCSLVTKSTKDYEWNYFNFLLDVEAVLKHLWKVFPSFIVMLFQCFQIFLYFMKYIPFNFKSLYIVFREKQRAVQVHTGAKKNLVVKVIFLIITYFEFFFFTYCQIDFIGVFFYRMSFRVSQFQLF